MNALTHSKYISVALIVLVSSAAAIGQPLNLDKDFHNSQFKENRVKRMKKVFRSASAQLTSEYEYDTEGYLVSFEKDSALARRAFIENPGDRAVDIRYTPARDKAFIMRGPDTLHWLSFDETKNLVHRRSAGAGSHPEVKYYYESGDLKFITQRKDTSSDKWITIQSFANNYRDGKLRSRKSDTAHTMYLYDNQGRLAEAYDSANRKGWIKYEYDNKDRTIAIYEMRPGNKDFTFCPYFTQNTYDEKGRLVKTAYATSAKNDKMGNCGYALAWSVDYKYKRSGLLKKETRKAKDGSGYTIKYKYR